MPQFDVSHFSSQLFWLITVFGCLYFLVSKLITPKIESILDNRKNFLEDNINHAEEYNIKTQSLEALRDLNANEVNALVKSMHAQAIEELNVNCDNRQLILAQELRQKKEQSMVEIENYINKFRLSKSEYCIKLASLIIHKITNKEADLQILQKIHGELK